jgi:hypothetical protein
VNPIEYKKHLAEYDERITSHKLKAQELEHERAKFVLSVMTATFEDLQKSIIPGDTEVTKR